MIARSPSKDDLLRIFSCSHQPRSTSRTFPLSTPRLPSPPGGYLLSDRCREHAGPVATKRWDDLSPRSRRIILVAGVFEGVLKVAALIDLVRRSSDEVRGSKRRWAGAIVMTNSVGA